MIKNKILFLFIFILTSNIFGQTLPDTHHNNNFIIYEKDNKIAILSEFDRCNFASGRMPPVLKWEGPSSSLWIKERQDIIYLFVQIDLLNHPDI